MRCKADTTPIATRPGPPHLGMFAGVPRTMLVAALASFLAAVFPVEPTHADTATDTGIDTSPAPRLVSINLCADQLLLELADPEQLLSVSRLSHDPAASHHLQRARRLPVNDASAESVLASAPDAVIAGEYSSHYTVRLLEASGLTVHRLPIANSLEQLLDNLLLLGDWIGQAARAEARVAGLRQRLAEVSAEGVPPPSAPLAAVYDPNGYTTGPASLRGEMLRLAGFRNVAERAGIDGYGRLSLESMLVHAPQVLIDSPFSEGTWSRAQALSLHPALRTRGLAPEVITLPSADTICGGPWSVALVERLAERRRELAASLAERRPRSQP